MGDDRQAVHGYETQSPAGLKKIGHNKWRVPMTSLSTTYHMPSEDGINSDTRVSISPKAHLRSARSFFGKDVTVNHTDHIAGKAGIIGLEFDEAGLPQIIYTISDPNVIKAHEEGRAGISPEYFPLAFNETGQVSEYEFHRLSIELDERAEKAAFPPSQGGMPLRGSKDGDTMADTDKDGNKGGDGGGDPPTDPPTKTYTEAEYQANLETARAAAVAELMTKIESADAENSVLKQYKQDKEEDEKKVYIASLPELTGTDWSTMDLETLRIQATLHAKTVASIEKPPGKGDKGDGHKASPNDPAPNDPAPDDKGYTNKDFVDDRARMNMKLGSTRASITNKDVLARMDELESQGIKP